MSEPITADIKGYKWLFYGKPKKQDSVWLWKRSGLFTREFDYYQTQKPAKRNFKDNTFVMILVSALIVYIT
ncbi:MAG: hypothetical protein R3E32_26090 [Chitinophagales bacterium]